MGRTRPPLDPAIHRVRLDKLRIFEISEAELEALEQGSPESVFLNVALAVLSSAISFSITLATTKIESDRVFTVFVVLTATFYLAAVLLGTLWVTSRRSTKSVAARIRARIPPEGGQGAGGPSDVTGPAGVPAAPSNGP